MFGENAPVSLYLGELFSDEKAEERWIELQEAGLSVQEILNGPSLEGGGVIEGDRWLKMILDRLPGTVKIVSISYGGGTPSGLLGANLPFASIAAAGNDGRDTWLSPDHPEPENEDLVNIRAAAAGKVLFVAGYDTFKAEDGVYERWVSSSGCVGMDEACIWAPFDFHHNEEGDPFINLAGTSVSAPHVAAALASVLAVFPETEGTELIRLAKACAIPTPTLPGGVGRADFTCMTVMDDGGRWRVVTAAEFAELISPAEMNRLVFPGAARVAGTFVVERSGRRFTLATRVPGLYGFEAGIPASLALERREAGFFPVLAGDAGTSILGGGYLGGHGWFAAAAYGDRADFFGLDGRHGYDGARALEVEAGHRNVFARWSRQWSSGRHIERVAGIGLGLTARAPFAVSAQSTVTAAVHVDRFAGGDADTSFGPVAIEASPWARRAELAFEREAPAGTVTVSADKRWAGAAAGVRLGYSVRF